MTDLVRLEYRASAAIVTLCRPESANALSEALLDELTSLGSIVIERADIRAVILTALGDKAFCAGADLKERLHFTEADVRRVLDKYRSGLAWLLQCEVPVVAAMNGSALGGGLELAMMCDLRVAVNHAQFALPETTLGIIPGAGGTQRLPRLIGTARATELILLGTRINAEQALAYGLINRIAEPGVAVLDDTLRWLKPVLEGAPIATREALQAVRGACAASLSEGLDAERVAYEECLMSEDRVEALRAFADKRPPQFKGK
jgi:enoyl-CoA hydratase/carnithine racemase